MSTTVYGLSRNKKTMHTPVNPSFTIYKCGLRGSKFYRHVFVMYFSKWDTMGNLSAKNVVFCYGAAKGPYGHPL